MKPLVDTAYLRERMSLMDHASVNSMLESLMSAAQTLLESLLSTKLLRGSVTDYFAIGGSGVIPRAPDGFFRLRLSRSMVRKLPTIEVLAGTTYAGVATTPPGAGTLILSEDAAHYYVDSDKGILYLNQVEVGNALNTTPRIGSFGRVLETFPAAYLRVKYDAGIGSTTETPDWLKEAICMLVPYLSQQQQVATKNEAKGPTYEANKEFALKLVEPYLRDVGITLKPIRSS